MLILNVKILDMSRDFLENLVVAVGMWYFWNAFGFVSSKNRFIAKMFLIPFVLTGLTVV